ncbi:MAG: hypothetical protein EBT92_00845 [Planctomycetes bacterium]|nr:hypothetical protein [Planctomycetota bacterium]NBY02498.1 hypothetical protein [Planctomycetota bacterium]
MDNYSNLAWINGNFIPQAEAALTLHDAGFVMGATVTDMSRSFAHKPFMLREHIQRFKAHCKACFIDIKKTELELLKAAEELIERNCLLLKPAEDLALVLFATPGPIGFYLGESGGAGDGLPTLGMHTFKLPFHRYRPWVEHGVELLTSSILQPSPLSINPSIKQRSRMHWWIAEREVKTRSSTATALLLDENGFLTETASSNLLILKDGAKTEGSCKILTPKSGKVLDGIALRMVKSFAKDSGIPWIESDILPSEVKSSDAAFITSNSFCFAPVKSLNGIQLSRSDWFNEKLLGYWQKQVTLNFHEQILKNL